MRAAVFTVVTFSVLIYRLDEPDAHCFASGRTYMSILEEAIHVTQMRRRDVRCFHYVPATPAGVHDAAEEAIILQTVRDIAPGSTEKTDLVGLGNPLPSIEGWSSGAGRSLAAKSSRSPQASIENKF